LIRSKRSSDSERIFGHPSGGSIGKLGMVLRLPATRRLAQRLALSMQLEFPFGQTGQKLRPFFSADDFVDSGNHVWRILN
jgi:hypothetical protein